MIPASEHIKRRVPTFKKILRYTLRYKPRLVWAVVCSVVVSVLSVVSITMLMPILEVIFKTRSVPDGAPAPTPTDPDFIDSLLSPLYALIDTYARGNEIFTLFIISVVFLVIVIINGLVKYIQQYLVYWLGSRVILDMQRELFEKITNYHSAYFARHRVGTLISYFTVDIRAVGQSIYKVFGQLLLDPFLLLITIAALLAIQWQLTLLYAIIFPAIIYTIRFFARKNRNAGRESQAITASMGDVLQEHFSNIRVVQAYGMQEHQKEKFWKESVGVFRATMRMLKAIAASSPINQAIGLFGFCCVLLVGAYFIFESNNPATSLDGPKFMIFLALLASIYQPTKRLERAIQDVQLGLAAADRVFDELEREANLPIGDEPININSFNNEIVFEDVCFSYEKNDPVLSGINLHVRKGEQVAIVGPSGAGKTTLVNLVPRFFDPGQGQIKIDGHDLREIDLESLRRLISLVPQETAVFSDTVWNNITCGDQTYSRDDVINAAKAAYAHDYLQALPEGYDTIIGERGSNLSGGQRQRLAIARAFLHDTPILILDEATSALDSESEEHIKRSLQNLLKGRTSFIIAHRLSTILQSDKIVVMNEGRIEDMGPHHELLKRCPLYTRLYDLQFSDQAGTSAVS